MATDAPPSRLNSGEAAPAIGKHAARLLGPHLIRQKLSRSTLIVAGGALLLAAFVIFVSDMIGSVRRTTGSLASAASVLARNLSAPLRLKDPNAIGVLLDAQLHGDSVTNAAVFEPDGARLAMRSKHPSDTLPDQLSNSIISGVSLSHDRTDYYEPIVADGLRIGTLLVRNDASPVGSHALGSLLTSFVVLVTGLAAARRLSGRCHAVVSEPLATLATTARQISTERNFQKRAVKCFDDEIGEVAEALNNICQEVVRREEELCRLQAELLDMHHEVKTEIERANAEIDTNVLARTSDLQKQIADGKRAEEAMKDSEMRYRNLFENNPMPMFVVHLETLRFVAVNFAAVNHYGYSMDEFLQFSLCELTRGADQRTVMRTFRSKEKSFNAGEWKHGKKNGSIIDVQLTAHAIMFGGQIAKIVLANDVTERNRAQRELDDLHKKLLTASRQAGQAEVATGVLHNVGNVLNSVNVSVSVLESSVKSTKAFGIRKVAELLNANRADLAAFFSEGGKGRMLPDYLSKLADQIEAERAECTEEFAQLTSNVMHIKEIVAMQQGYAKVAGFVDNRPPATLIEEALRMTAGDMENAGLKTVIECPDTVPNINADPHKVMQILVNLLSNARQALESVPADERQIIIRAAYAGGPRASITVQDNGCGIPEENLTRIFNHGFTTKPNGHGFGLHAAANAAKEMNGSLTATSPGSNNGATFTLEIPILVPAANQDVSRRAA